MEDIIKAKIEEVQAKLASIGLPKIEGITFEIKRLKAGISGLAQMASRHISISSDYLREHEEQIIGRTVPHEVCHIYVYTYFKSAKQAHGPEFRKLMDFLGCDNSTYHSMSLVDGPQRQVKTKTRYIYITASGKTAKLTKAQHTRAVNKQSRYSLQGERLSFTGEIELFK